VPAGSATSRRPPTVVIAVADLAGVLVLMLSGRRRSPPGRARSVVRRTEATRPVDAHLFEPGPRSTCSQPEIVTGRCPRCRSRRTRWRGVGQDQNGSTVYEANETLRVELVTARSSARPRSLRARVAHRERDGPPLASERPRPWPVRRAGRARRRRGTRCLRQHVQGQCSWPSATTLATRPTAPATAYDTVRPFSPHNLKLPTLMQDASSTS
jgi:hypothetical protein